MKLKGWNLAQTSFCKFKQDFYFMVIMYTCINDYSVLQDMNFTAQEAVMFQI